MPRNPNYDLLFEPIKIGPVTAKNRFYQVPHCTGMGYDRPETQAGMRGIKADGGWAVVNTEYCSIHPSSDDTPHSHCTLWDEGDIRNLGKMAEKVHEHGALAGVEMWHGGPATNNMMSRMPAIGAASTYSFTGPMQCRIMDQQDIRDLRRYHVEAAKRAMQAEFDIVYVYAGHHYLLHQFLSSHTNNRSDEYGGSVENRVRLVREILKEVKDTVGHRCAVATRFSVDSGLSAKGTEPEDEAREMVSILADIPDLWDVVIDDYSIEMGPSRFIGEAPMEPFVSYVKKVTQKPVVGVGRFTTPDTMARMVKKGILDLIGAARPSIADPFIPNKISEGREDEIRECIGCNICYAHDFHSAPLRCTQNPTMGEEWRRDWHPENVPPKTTDEPILVIGAGPAGLEAAHILGKRGYPVTLAEATKELGGRALKESTLPGMSEYARVKDYRIYQLQQMANVSMYLESPLTAPEVLEFGFSRVIIATGAKWRRDGMGRSYQLPLRTYTGENLFTPDDIMNNKPLPPTGHTVIFDDEHYYMAAVIAERMIELGESDVTLVTSAGRVGDWSEYTGEQFQTQARLIELGVNIIVSHTVSEYHDNTVTLDCVYSGRQQKLAATCFIPVTSRMPNEGLYRDLKDNPDALEKAGITHLSRIGDCDAPRIIAAAVFDGHHIGRTIDDPEKEDVPYLRDRALVQ
ncbi:FAD-dependent oxidoreductase [Curvivirga sp.]|uniref:oxidoreductase n=1 Tax=Curvivirga sp. TaxID=2856848 RepID=UPI003B5A1A33